MVKTLLDNNNFDPDHFFENEPDAYLDELRAIVLPVSVTTLNEDQQKLYIKLVQMAMLHIPISTESEMDMSFQYNNSIQIHKVSITELSAMFEFYTQPIGDNALKLVVPRYIVQKIQQDLKAVTDNPFLPDFIPNQQMMHASNMIISQDLSEIPNLFEPPIKKRRLDVQMGNFTTSADTSNRTIITKIFSVIDPDGDEIQVEVTSFEQLKEKIASIFNKKVTQISKIQFIIGERTKTIKNDEGVRIEVNDALLSIKWV